MELSDIGKEASQARRDGTISATGVGTAASAVPPREFDFIDHLSEAPESPGKPRKSPGKAPLRLVSHSRLRYHDFALAILPTSHLPLR